MIPPQHDHVGHMRYTETACWCEGCGATWHRVEAGWRYVGVQR